MIEVSGGHSAPAPQRTALLINARSRRGAQAESAVSAALAAHGLVLARVVHLRRPRQLIPAVDFLLREGTTRLIVGGGDGTLGTAAARLALTGVELGMIPLGTANDFARTLEIPDSLPKAARIAAGSFTREIDLARANDVHFVNVASIGMSAALTRSLTTNLKLRLGVAAYVVAGALAFVRHLAFRARIDSPAGSTDGIVHQVVVANGRFYGGGVLVARDSSLEDGLLTVYTLGRRGRLKILGTLTLLRLGTPLARPGDVYLRAPSVYVETDPPGLPVNLDGELRTTTPVTMTVVPKALRVLVAEPEAK